MLKRLSKFSKSEKGYGGNSDGANGGITTPDMANGARAMQGVNPQMNFAYEYSAVMAEHGKNDDDLRSNMHTKVEQIQICREEIKRIRNK